MKQGKKYLHKIANRLTQPVLIIPYFIWLELMKLGAWNEIYTTL